MDFYKRMGLVCCSVPRGRVASYGQIALLCGRPKNARQVGYGLNRGRAGEVPAHRIVNSQGFLTGALAFGYPDLQRLLLKQEGVEVSPDNRVDLGKYGWNNSLEEALALARQFEKMGI